MGDEKLNVFSLAANANEKCSKHVLYIKLTLMSYD